MNSINRRSFLKVLGGTVGGAILSTGLTGCGGSSDSSAPNAYRFYRVKNLGNKTGETGRTMEIKAFSGAVHISRDGLVTYDAIGSGNRKGIFQLWLDIDAFKPVIKRERTSIMLNETLADGSIVGRIKSIDVNSDGSIAADIIPKHPSGQKATHFGSGLYLDKKQQGFRPVFTYGQKFIDDSIYSTGLLGDIDLHEDNHILFSGNFNQTGGTTPHGEGLLYLPSASVNDAKILLATGDFVPTTNHSVDSIGLLDLHDNGNYVVQGEARPLDVSAYSTQNGEIPSHTFVYTGNVNNSENILLGAAPEISGANIRSDAFYGPRIDNSGGVYSLTWDESDEHMQLYYRNSKIISSGDLSPDKNTILYLSTGSVGKNDRLFYATTSHDTDGYIINELVRYSGITHSTLLATGDVLSDGGAPVENIIFGGTTKHVDDNDNLVFFCTFTDGTTSLVIGIPA